MTIRNQTPETCHCGSPMNGSDHCPHCGCEEYERYCNARHPDRHADTSWCAGAVPNEPPVPVAPNQPDPRVMLQGEYGGDDVETTAAYDEAHERFITH